MKLTSARITEFQSIRDTTQFEIGNITCLVGKNEAGKTAILRALYRLNPIIPEENTFDVTDDYPRSDVEDYIQDVEAHKREPAIVITATFSLDNQEIESSISEFKTDIFITREVILTRGYENNTSFAIQLNDSLIIKSLLEQAQLPTEIAVELNKTDSYDSLLARISELYNEDSKEHLDRLNQILAKIKEYGGFDNYVFAKHIEPYIPKFMYFDEFFIMTGAENIEQLKTRLEQNKLKDSDRPLLGLIELARLNLDELLNPQRTEDLINKLEGASNHLSKRILKYWSQNKHVSMKFDVRSARPGDPEGMKSGTNIWARVNDSKREVSTPLGSRSRGFVWFFSFLAWFDQQKRQTGSLILLLDEPGLFLHGRAQGDLLNYIDAELGPQHQVLYTTHSPFMVDVKKFDRVRIVQDKSIEDEEIGKEEEGTKVLSDIFEASEDSLFPLQGALGYDICQSLFIGPYSLIVEGVSDLLYLQTISAFFERNKKISLDNRWVITPVGGADHVPTFVKLLGAQKGITVATLIDIEKNRTQRIESLYKSKLLKKQNVLTFRNFTGNDEADIEDMFGDVFYISLINKEYADSLAKPISQKDLTDPDPRILKRLEKYFEKNPLSDGTNFSHFRPARLFSTDSTLIEVLPVEVIERFENAFKTLNGLLS